MNISQTDTSVFVVKFDDIRDGWEQWVLLSSDRHHDNRHCEQRLERRHLELARERKALVFDFGDLFCAMQGKYDPRSSMEQLRPEHKTDRYLDALLDTAEEFYKPYADLFGVLARGNHETNVINRHGTDLTTALVDRLRQHGSDVRVGGFGGWVRFQFVIQKTRGTSLNLRWFHGAGSEAPVSKGVIESERQSVYLPDAHIIVNGHNHNQYVVSVARSRLSDHGKLHRDIQLQIRTPSYKDEYGAGSDGWAVERGHRPKPLGCVWLRLYYARTGVAMEATAMVE